MFTETKILVWYCSFHEICPPREIVAVKEHFKLSDEHNRLKALLH